MTTAGSTSRTATATEPWSTASARLKSDLRRRVRALHRQQDGHGDDPGHRRPEAADLDQADGERQLGQRPAVGLLPELDVHRDGLADEEQGRDQRARPSGRNGSTAERQDRGGQDDGDDAPADRRWSIPGAQPTTASAAQAERRARPTSPGFLGKGRRSAPRLAAERRRSAVAKPGRGRRSMTTCPAPGRPAVQLSDPSGRYARYGPSGRCGPNGRCVPATSS